MAVVLADEFDELCEFNDAKIVDIDDLLIIKDINVLNGVWEDIREL